jgi:hypothetical protein
MYQDGFPITGRVWFRESTQEWILELSGTINDCCFTSRHTAPKDTNPEDVPGLGHIYKKLRKLGIDPSKIKK